MSVVSTNQQKILKVFVLFLCFLVVGSLLWEKKHPTPQQLYEQGLAAVHVQQWDTVLHCSDSLLDNSEFTSHASLLRGFELLHRGRLDQALQSFSKANNHTATRQIAYFEAGKILYQQKQYFDCIQLFRQVTVWNADHIEAERMLAAAYYDIGAMDESLHHLDQVVRLDPEDFRPHYMKAQILTDFERFGDAAISFKDAASLVPQDSMVADEVLAGWGDCLVRLRRYEESLKVMLPARPWPDILGYRAQACFSLRRFDEARTLAEQALTDSPFHVDAVIVAAQCYEQQKEYGRAKDLIQQCLKVHPQELRLHHRIADILGSEGQSEEALAFRNRAGEIAELRAAFSDAHQAAIRDIANAELRLKLGEIAEKLDEIEIARNWYQAALGMSPASPKIREQWQRFQDRYPPPQQPEPVVGTPPLQQQSGF